MNIFFVSTNPIQAAQMLCNKHIAGKMIVESAQMLSTAHRVLDGIKMHEKNKNNKNTTYYKLNNPFLDSILYKATHINHPSTIWARSTSANYQWLYQHFVALCDEFTYRYNKLHLTDKKLRKILLQQPNNICKKELENIPLAMPNEYKQSDSIKAYRTYYKSKQTKFKMIWTKRKCPNWFTLTL